MAVLATGTGAVAMPSSALLPLGPSPGAGGAPAERRVGAAGEGAAVVLLAGAAAGGAGGRPRPGPAAEQEVGVRRPAGPGVSRERRCPAGNGRFVAMRGDRGPLGGTQSGEWERGGRWVGGRSRGESSEGAYGCAFAFLLVGQMFYVCLRLQVV